MSVSAVMPLGVFSRKSCAIPPANPTTAPSCGPSRIAMMIVTRYISSGFTPSSFICAKTVDCSSSAVTITTAMDRTRRVTSSSSWP